MSGDSADQLVNRRVAFYVHEFRYGDGAKSTYLPEIIAQEIDDHQVFRMALHVVREPFTEPLIFSRVGATANGALDRFRLHDAGGTDLQKPFHRRTSHLNFRKLQVG